MPVWHVGHREHMATTTDNRPAPDAPEKLDGPRDLDRRSWFYVLRKTVREFSDDQCTDLAAALTYYAVLALFPAAIALTSLLGLVGRGTDAVDQVLEILRGLGASGVADSVGPTLQELSRSQSAGLGAHPGPGRCAVVGEWLRGRLRASHEPGVRDRRGTARLEAPARDAAADSGARRAGGRGAARTGRHRSGRR